MQPYAGVGRRALATVIDLTFIGVFVGIMLALFGEVHTSTTVITTESGRTTTQGVNYVLGGWSLVATLAIVAVYYVAMEMALGGTLGKLIAGLRVRKEDGSPVTFQAALLRLLLRPVDALFFYFVAAIAVWATPKHQRLGDLLAKTVVVNRSDVRAPMTIPAANPA
jgi:uncharacterized RDD family membrane protein YckC